MSRLADFLRSRIGLAHPSEATHATAPSPSPDPARATLEFLARLEAMDWFCHLGQPFDAGPEVARVVDWDRALRICRSQRTDDAQLQSQNELTVQLHANHRALHQLWNHKVNALRPRVDELVDRKLAMPAVNARLPAAAIATIFGALQWEVLSACIAREHEHAVPLTPYRALYDHWLLAGHFPCGWLGRVPTGMKGAFDVGRLAVM